MVSTALAVACEQRLFDRFRRGGLGATSSGKA